MRMPRISTALGLVAVLGPWLAAAAATPAAVGELLDARQTPPSSPPLLQQTNVTVQEGGISTTFSLPLRAVPNVVAGTPIRPGTELRILCIGDSITVGTGSSTRDGYREGLKANLAGDDVVFAGTEQGGAMDDGYFVSIHSLISCSLAESTLTNSSQGAWSGQTIQFMSEHIDASLAQLPNVILLHAGTNDMNPRPEVSVQGSDPVGAADRLGKFIDKITTAVPDAVVLVAVIINSCAPIQQNNVREFQALIPGVVQPRLEAGKHVLAVDFSQLGDVVLSTDCIHPGNQGYDMMADQWYNFMTQIPPAWIQLPIGDDPTRQSTKLLEPPEGATSTDPDAGKDNDAGSSDAGPGRSAPFWAVTAAAAAWHLTSWMTTA